MPAAKAKKKKPAAPAPPKKKRRHEQYSDAFRAHVLAEWDSNGGNTSHTARTFHIKRTTVLDWVKGRVPVPPALRQEKKRLLADVLEETAIRMCDGLTPADPNCQKVATSVGIVVDKWVLVQTLRLPGQADPGSNGRPAYDFSKLTPAEIFQLAKIHGKALPGHEDDEPENESDLDNPVLAGDQGDDVEAAPAPQPQPPVPS